MEEGDRWQLLVISHTSHHLVDRAQDDKSSLTEHANQNQNLARGVQSSLTTEHANQNQTAG